MINSIITTFLILCKTTFLPSIEDTITLKEWLCLGPFSVGVREGVIGVDERIDLYGDFEPDTDIFYPSILAQGGKVKWQKVGSINGNVKIEYENVFWDTIQDYYGAPGILSAGYAYTDFYNHDSTRALIIAKGVSSYRFNGKTYLGDRYKDGFLKIPVILKNGKNRVILKLSGFGDHAFSFKIIPAPEPLKIVAKDITVPDFLWGEKINTWLGIPVVNTTGKRFLDIQLRMQGKGIKENTQHISSIMPLSAVKIPVKIETENIIGPEVDSILVTVTISFEDFSTQEDFRIKFKDKNEAYEKTFLSKIDNSCQYYAVLPPENYNSDNTYALIMTCHGAGVKAQNQVKAYTQKDWAFVVAPTNRRRFGFNWENWGRLDFLEVLEDVKKNFKIDTNRIYLTGHSMGGHGAWLIGTSHPDLFAAMAPSAGWTSIQLYIPFFLQKSYTFAHPEQLKFRDMVTREDNPLLFLDNLCNLPTYILQGGLDDNVPPIQSRMFNKYLSQLDYDFVYNEVEGKGHWWNIDSTPGVDCVDSEEMMNFLRNCVRDPYPKKVVFKTSDIEHSNQAYWVRIDELEKPYQEGKIEAQNDGLEWLEDMHKKNDFLPSSLVIKSSNINKFTISLDSNSTSPWGVNFTINNQKIKHRAPSDNYYVVSFCKNGDKFKIGKTKEKGLGKKKNLYGPIKRAYFNPFVLVYGTRGDSSSTENYLHQARLQSFTWWYRANGFVEILPDTEITKEIIKDYNLILFGNPATNSILKWINHKLPARVEEGSIIVHNRMLKQKDLCLMQIFPNPLNPEKFVLLYSPTSKQAEKIMGLFTPLYSGSGLPDFFVYDKSTLKYGWAGVVATGFFNKEWKFDRNLSYIKN